MGQKLFYILCRYFNSGKHEKNELDNGEIRNFQRSEKQTYGSMESTDFKKSEISTSESLYIRLQEVDYIGTNENKINNKYNYTESSDT